MSGAFERMSLDRVRDVAGTIAPGADGPTEAGDVPPQEGGEGVPEAARAAPMACGDRVAAEARGWIGTPYVHQAACRGAGTDCLGLVRGIWAAVVGDWPAGLAARIPAYTPDWNEIGGGEHLWDAARRFLLPADGPAPLRGDVLLFRMRRGAVAKHLGIVVEGGPQARFVHAYSGHGVVENALSEAWAARVVGRFAFPARWDGGWGGPGTGTEDATQV